MKELEQKLHDLANGKTTVAEILKWINDNFILVPQVEIPDPLEIPDIDLGG